jgi:hypothetical protein
MATESKMAAKSFSAYKFQKFTFFKFLQLSGEYFFLKILNGELGDSISIFDVYPGTKNYAGASKCNVVRQNAI